MERGERIENRPTRRNAFRGRRALIGGGAGLLGVLTVLMLTASQAGALNVVSFSPPYSSFISTPSSTTGSYGSCASVVQTSTPAFSLTTGTLHFRSHAALTSCPTGLNYADGSVSSSLQTPSFAGPNFGTNYVYVSWTTGYNVHLQLNVPTSNTTGNGTGNGTSGYAFGSAYLTIYAYLIDASTGAFVAGSGAYSTTTIASFSFSATGSATASTTPVSSTTFLYGIMHKNQTYYVEVAVDASLYLESYNTAASGSATINLAGTNGITLNSISVY